MGYRTRVEGEFQISPTLTWGEISASQFVRSKPVDGGIFYTARGVDLKLLVDEQEKTTDEGVAFIRTASRLVMPHVDEYKAYDLVEQVQKVVDMFPDHTFSGELECEGEENTDIWRVEILGGQAVKVEPKIMWPKELAALYVEEWKRFRGKVLNEVWCALRDAEDGPMLDAMTLVNALHEKPDSSAS